MNNLFKQTTLTAVLATAFFAAGHVAAQDISIIGAEKAGNAARTIPAWDGGHTSMAGSQPGGPYADPYAADQPIVSITAANAEKYKANLTVGQLEMLKKFPSYKINVYPTHRSAPVSKCVIAETTANKGKAKPTSDAKGITGAAGGVLFPTPKDGVEAVWNALTRFRGDTYSAKWAQVAVNTDGKLGTTARFEVEYDFHFGACARSQNDREANRLFNYMQRITEPSRLAGQLLLVQESLDPSRDPRSAWTYNPGQRRVRLAPEVSYDNPGFGAEGLRTADDLSLFNGAPDRYRWKLIGKREVYVPYNNFKALDASVSIDKLTDDKHINPDLLRYELHRVYVVEGDLRDGESHLYHRRTLYLDEDSWMIVATDKYDRNGKFWRYSEMYSVPAPDLGFIYPAMDAHYDLQSSRYLVSGIRSGEGKLATPLKRTASDFTPQRLRGEGTR